MIDRFFSGVLVFSLMAVATAMLASLMFAPQASTAPRQVQLERVVITASRDAASPVAAGGVMQTPVMQRRP